MHNFQRVREHVRKAMAPIRGPLVLFLLLYFSSGFFFDGYQDWEDVGDYLRNDADKATQVYIGDRRFRIATDEVNMVLTTDNVYPREGVTTLHLVARPEPFGFAITSTLSLCFAFALGKRYGARGIVKG